LSPDDRTALEAAYDGRDHNDTAFARLLEHVRGWPKDLDPGGFRAVAALDGFGVAPAVVPESLRGTPVVVAGRLAQASPLESYWNQEGARVEEWFVRTDGGLTVLVLAVDPPSTAAAGRTAVTQGTRVVVEGVVYKRIDAVARDGQLRSFPAVVGRMRDVVASPLDGLLPLAFLVVVLLVVFMVLRGRVRSIRARDLRSGRRGGGRSSARVDSTA
jgi:hypothetical protein